MIKKSSNLSKGIAFLMIQFLMLSLCPVGWGQSGEAAQTDYLRAKATRPNGQIIVQLKEDSRWVDAGSIAMDKYLREGSVTLGDIKPASDGLINIRLLKEGGGAAYLDAVFLQGTPPAGINVINDLALKKLADQDLDLVAIGQEGLVLTFPAKQEQASLSITGRIESTRISTIPFQFPLENCYQSINANSSFYNYRLDSVKGSLQVDGSIDEVNPKEPFMQEHVVPGSGHPSGYTYAWVMNDQQNLYITLDFTPDNTLDGEKDYAKVYINTNNGVKEYKVSVPETTWGQPGFIYTDKVGYQHKVYEFAIPLNEISLAEGQDDIQLAFAAYGTAALGEYYPVITYDEVNSSYFTAFPKITSEGCRAYGQFVSSDGTITGDVELGEANFYWGSISVASGVYGGDSRYLSVWSAVYEGDDTIMGVFVDPSTESTVGDTIIISDTDAIPKAHPRIAYDSANGRYLVVWEDYRYHPTGYRSYDIYGQLLNFDGSTLGGNFIICDNGNLDSSADQHNPFVAFDSQNEKYLVVWEDFRNGINDIYGQVVNADGTLYGTASQINFAVSETKVNKDNPVAAYDSINKKFLVVWEQGAHGSRDIYGKLVDTSMNSWTEIKISTASENQEKPAVAFSKGDGQFMVVWEDNRNAANTGRDIYGQMISADGTLYPDAGDSTTNMVIVARDSDQFGPGVAYNQQDNSFMVGFSTKESPYYLTYSVMPPPPQPVEFAPKVDYPVGGQPNSVTAGDFNNDGKLDLAVANGNSGDFSILLNNGDGTFGDSYKGGGYYSPNWIATEDLDADGNLDIVLVGGAALQVFKGGGDGSFELLTSCSTGTSPNTVVIADFNGDAQKDMAVSNYHSHDISIFLNNGNGTFGLKIGKFAQANATIPVGQNPARLIAADFDGNGRLDLAVNNEKGDTVSVLLGDGSGNFTDAGSFPCGNYPLGLATADVNGDGKLDLIISNFETNFDNQGNVTILKGRGDGSFEKLTDVMASDGTIGTVVGDFNGDSKIDLAVTNRYRNNVSILCGNGMGGFAPKQNFNVGDSPFNLTTADFNKDGSLDLAVVNNGGGTVSLLLGKTPGARDTKAPTWPGGSSLAASGSGTNSLTLTWTAAADNVGVTGYRIYKNGSLEKAVGNVLTTVITGLSPSTSYSFKVEACDAAGNWSTGGPVTTASTQAVVESDTEAPTWPGGSSLAASGSGTNSLTLTWTAAADNVGVTGYRIYKNGSLEKAVDNVLSTVITGLSSSTTYSFKVEARDAAGNWSTGGPEITATTAAVSSSGGGGGTPALAISTTDAPKGTASTAYKHTFTVSGGRSPYTFAVTGGELPPGMSLSREGILSGTPTVPGTYNYTITVTDTAGRTNSRTYTQVIVQGAAAPEAAKSRKIILTLGHLRASIDGQEYNLLAAPYAKAEVNRTMVPLRFISEALDAKVEWNPESRQIVITDGQTQIILTIGANQVFVNGIPHMLDCAAEILPPGYTFVPLRFISETLGATIDYDELTKQITITRKGSTT